MDTYSAQDIKEAVPLSRYLADMGVTVRGGRCVAAWRDGDGWNVSVDDGGGKWYDHARNCGGSVIDLCMAIERLDFQGAVRSLAARYGVAPLTASERAASWRMASRHRVRAAEPRRPAFTAEPDFVHDTLAPYLGKASMDALAERSPFPVDWPREAQTDLFLSAGWRSDEWLNLGNSGRKWRRGQPGDDLRTVDGWRTIDGRQPVHFNDGNPEFDLRLYYAPWWTGGGFDCIFRNPYTGEADAEGRRLTHDCVSAFLYVLMEFDNMDEPGGDLPNQCAFWMGFLDDPAWRPCIFSLVYSGWKSIHGLLAVPRGADPERLDELLKARFCASTRTAGTGKDGAPVYPFRADPAGFTLQSGTRLAGVRRLGDVSHGRGRIQRLLYINPRLGYGWGQADRQADRNPPA